MLTLADYEEQDEYTHFHFLNSDNRHANIHEYYTQISFLNHGKNESKGVALQIGRDGCLPKEWILQDNQSTVDVFCNKHLLKNICKHTHTMSIHCNLRVTTTNLVGKLVGYGTVSSNSNRIANILSLAHL
jgi:hypothetical protein